MAIIQSYPGQTLPETWLSGFIISNDATTPNTVLNIGAGVCRDSNNVMDICLGSNNANFEDQVVVSPLVLNTAANGVNGLDTGVLVASKLYAVYVIGDSTYQRPTASLMSLASNALPLMPAGYDSFRLIGYSATNGSVFLLKCYESGTMNDKLFIYDIPQQVLSTATGSATYAPVDLSNFVPWQQYVDVILTYVFTPGVSTDTFKLQTFNGGTSSYQFEGTSGRGNAEVLASQDAASTPAGKPKINYKNTGTDVVALLVVGYRLSL